MILRLALPCSLTFRLVPRWGHCPSPLSISKETNLTAARLFYESNTILVLGDDISTSLQKHAVRLDLRGDIDASCLRDLQRCSKLRHLTLCPDHAPKKAWKRPFQKPLKLSHTIIKESENAQGWRNFIDSNEPQPSLPNIRSSSTKTRSYRVQ